MNGGIDFRGADANGGPSAKVWLKLYASASSPSWLLFFISTSFCMCKVMNAEGTRSGLAREKDGRKGEGYKVQESSGN